MIFRLETKKDWHKVENLTREAFWNVYRPGCNEHLVLHNFRQSACFVKELDYVIEENNQIIAHIMYCKTFILTDNHDTKEILMFGPISVDPKFQGKGYGSKIIELSISKAKMLGYGAIAITGNPLFYHRFGFVSASKYHIYYPKTSRDEESSFFMIKELQVGYLKNISGLIIEPAEYSPSDNELEKFEKLFPKKIKQKLPGQLI